MINTMKITAFIFVIALSLSINIFAQFSIDSFINESFDKNYFSFKSHLSDKKIEEREIMNFKAILYYDWLDPISIKVGYLFNEGGKQLGKVISNGKENEEDAKKLFDSLQNSLVSKFGSNFLEQSMMGIIIISWKEIENYSVILTKSEKKTMLTILRKE